MSGESFRTEKFFNNFEGPGVCRNTEVKFCMFDRELVDGCVVFSGEHVRFDGVQDFLEHGHPKHAVRGTASGQGRSFEKRPRRPDGYRKHGLNSRRAAAAVAAAAAATAAAAAAAGATVLKKTMSNNLTTLKKSMRHCT